MLVRQKPVSTDHSMNTESSKITIWKTFISSLVAAAIAGAGAFVGMQKEMAVVSNSVNKMTMTMEKIADKQTTFFESFYVPLALKVEQQGSNINSLANSVNGLKDEMRYMHPNISGRGYNQNGNRQ